MKKIMILFLSMVALAGCAVSSRYVDYTDQKYPPKPKYYYVTVYEAQPVSSTQAFQVIGRVETAGYINNGVTSDSLIDKAKAIARVRGADAIINAKTETLTFNGVDFIPGYRRRYHYRPDQYIAYSETLLRFRGELIVFLPAGTPADK